MKRKNGFIHIFAEYGITLCLFLGVGAFVVYGLQEASKGQEEEALRIATDSIMRAAVTCYALEGNYPPTYEYIKEHYGIQIDEEKYSVFYDIFASNMMPDITVVEK